MSKVRRTFVTVCIILCLLSFAAGITLYLPHAENAVPDGIAGTKQIVLNGDFETAQEKSPDVRIGEDGSVVPSVDMSGMYVINNIYAGTNHVFFTEYNASKDKYYDTSENTIQEAKKVLSFASGQGHNDSSAIKVDYSKFVANTSRNLELSPKYRVSASELQIGEATKYYEISYWAKAESGMDKNLYTRPHFSFLRGSNSEYGNPWYAQNLVSTEAAIQYTLLAPADAQATEWIRFKSVMSVRLGDDDHVYFKASLGEEERDLGIAPNFGQGSTDSFVIEFVSLTQEGYLPQVPVYLDDITVCEYFPKYDATVTVYDAQEQPLAGATLTVKNDDGVVSEYATVTDNGDGTYTIANLYDNDVNIVYAQKDGIALGQVLVTGDNRNVSAGPFSKSLQIEGAEGEVTLTFSPAGGTYQADEDTPGKYNLKLYEETSVTIAADYSLSKTINITASSPDLIQVQLESALVDGNLLADADSNFVNANAVSQQARQLYKFSSVVGEDVKLSHSDEYGYTGTNSLKAEVANQNYINFTLFDGENGIESDQYYKITLYAYAPQAFGTDDSSLLYFAFSPKLQRTSGSFGFVPSDAWSDYKTYCVIGNKGVAGGWTKIETEIFYSYDQERDKFTYNLGGQTQSITNVESIESIDFELLAATGTGGTVLYIDSVSLIEYEKVITQSDFSSNYIKDGDIETGSSLSEVPGVNNAFAFTGTTTGTAEQTSEEVKNGEYAMKLQFKQQNYFTYRFASSGAAAQTAFPADVNYKISGWLKSNEASTLYIGFMVGFKDESNGPTIMAYLTTSYSKDEEGNLYKNERQFDFTTGSNFMTYQFAKIEFDGVNTDWKNFESVFSYSISEENYFSYTINGKTYTVTDAEGNPLSVPTTSAYGISFVPGSATESFYLDSFSVYSQYDGQITAYDQAGDPVTDAELKITDGFGTDITQSVDIDDTEKADGIYKFPDLYGPISVTFVGYEGIIDPIKLDSNAPEKVAEPPYTATLKFLTPSGDVIKSGIEIIVTQNGEPVGYVTFDEQTGIFKIEDLVGVNITVFASSTDWLFPVNNFVLQRGENEITVAEKVMPAYTATITLKDSSGKGIAGATIIIKKDGVAVGTVTERQNGTYTVSGLNDDGLTVEVTKEGYSFETGKTVSRSSANITLTGTVTEITQEPQGGCNGNASLYSCVILSIVLLAGAVAITFKKRTQHND